MSTRLDVLLKAREIISDIRQWTQGVSAEDKRGVSVRATDRDACKWCASGAVYRAASLLKFKDPECVYDVLCKVLEDKAPFPGYAPRPTQVNDYRGHAATLVMFDDAIEYARKLECSKPSSETL